MVFIIFGYLRIVRRYVDTLDVDTIRRLCLKNITLSDKATGCLPQSF